jgi:hypothetical protein
VQTAQEPPTLLVRVLLLAGTKVLHASGIRLD